MLIGQYTDHTYPQPAGYTGSKFYDKMDEIYGPHIKTKWNQGSPYSDYCDGNPYVGCWPVAMIQLFAYRTWPHPTKIDSRISSSWRELASVVNYSFTWSTTTGSGYKKTNPDLNISKELFELRKRELGYICSSLGKALDAIYKPTGTGVYDKTAVKWMKKHYVEVFSPNFDQTNMRWAAMNNIPVIITAYTTVRGAKERHAWLIDGWMIDTTYGEDWENGKMVKQYVASRRKYVHCNWGWGGTADGWYYINLLDPSKGSEDDFWEARDEWYPSSPGRDADENNGGDTNAGHYHIIDGVYFVLKI